MQLKSLADLLVFLALNITGIFLLFSVILFFHHLFTKSAQHQSAFESFNYKLVNKVASIAILCTFFISFIILGKDFLIFFENRLVIVIVIAGFLNFIYAGWLKK